MATKVFFGTTLAGVDSGTVVRGFQSANLAGTQTGFATFGVSGTQGTSFSTLTTSTVAGPTSGIEIVVASTDPVDWISDGLAAGVTISGTITFNLWGLESNMSANAGFQVVIERLDSQFAFVSTVVNSERGVELGTAAAVNNWTAAPTSTTFSRGDHLRFRIAINDVGTMGTGFTTDFYYGGPAAAQGDSFVSFTEAVTFDEWSGTAPSGTTLYLTDTSGEVNPDSVTSKDLWTSRGAGSVTKDTNTVAGWTNPVQMTAGAGSTAIEWFTHQLSAFTLSGPIWVNFYTSSSSGTVAATVAWEIAICDSSGGSPVVWGKTQNGGKEALATYLAQNLIWGVDTSVTDGQRLRLRAYIDDGPSAGTLRIVAPMVNGQTVSIGYGSTSGGTGSDTFITLSNTVTQFTASGQVPYLNIYPPFLAQ